MLANSCSLKIFVVLYNNQFCPVTQHSDCCPLFESHHSNGLIILITTYYSDSQNGNNCTQKQSQLDITGNYTNPKLNTISNLNKNISISSSKNTKNTNKNPESFRKLVHFLREKKTEFQKCQLNENRFVVFRNLNPPHQLI